MKLADCAESGSKVSEWIKTRPSGCGGVYAIVNLETGRTYIGSTIAPFEQRWYWHYQGLRRAWNSAGTSKNLRADWDIYGPSCFEAVELEQITDETTMRRRESEWINVLRSVNYPLYNASRARKKAAGAPAERERETTMPRRNPLMCLRCLGYGRITLKRKWAVCPDCNGSGNKQAHTSAEAGE